MQTSNKNAPQEQFWLGAAAGTLNNGLGVLGGVFTKQVTLTVLKPLAGAAVESMAGASLLMLLAYRDRIADGLFRRGRSATPRTRLHLTRPVVINMILAGLVQGAMKAMLVASLVTVSVGVMSPLGMAVPLALYGIEAWRACHPAAAVLVPLVTLIGVALIAHPQKGEVNLTGVVYALGYGAANAVLAVLNGRLLSIGGATKKEADQVGLKAFAWAALLGAVALAVFSASTGSDFGPVANWRVAVIMISGAGLFSTVPRMLYAVARRSLSLGTFSLLGATIPVMALLGDVVASRRPPDVSQALGVLAIVVVACGVAYLKGRDERLRLTAHGVSTP
ncbi:EamA family transporter [Actinomadura verrucosospora]|uniref:EamA-like transporter family protein n=1 Tax=Actinomadura verrucosospora TaxID=46165 RepID=A0A7D3ZPI3_ACTVE|nr:EamA family transporter [Actinomadura verrucosospora]QKG23342.1 eamA-like transporter family protein [Actinomadura verrucosospora]